MVSGIDKKRSFQHLIYALISAACPFLGLGVILIYQHYSYDWYWKILEKPQPLDDADINAAAIMGIIIVVQMVFAVGIGALAGLVFAGMSLRRKPRILSLGTAALLLNLLPLIAVIVFFFDRLVLGDGF